MRIKKIPGFAGKYGITKNGKIWSYVRGHWRKIQMGSKGYKTIMLTGPNGKHTNSLTIHRLIAKTWIPNPKNHKYVNHKNGIKGDSRLENLEWCSKSHDCKESWRLGLQKWTPKKDRAARQTLKNILASKK